MRCKAEKEGQNHQPTCQPPPAHLSIIHSSIIHSPVIHLLTSHCPSIYCSFSHSHFPSMCHLHHPSIHPLSIIHPSIHPSTLHHPSIHSLSTLSSSIYLLPIHPSSIYSLTIDPSSIHGPLSIYPLTYLHTIQPSIIHTAIQPISEPGSFDPARQLPTIHSHAYIYTSDFH